MSPLERLCGADELAEGEVRHVEVHGRAICVARATSGVYAIEDVCSHEDFPLSEGDFDPETCEIECYKHGSLFSVATGEALTLPATRPVATYRVEISDGELFVELP